MEGFVDVVEQVKCEMGANGLTSSGGEGGGGWMYALSAGFALGSAITWYIIKSTEINQLNKRRVRTNSTDAFTSFISRNASNDSTISVSSAHKHRSLNVVDDGDADEPSTTIGHSCQEDFLTGIFSQLWGSINPALSTIIRDAVEPLLKEYFPSGPLKSIQLVKVDLGARPIHIDHVVVHELRRQDQSDPKSDEYVQWDMDVMWDGDCEVGFKASVGRFGVKSIKLFGRMSFQLKPLTKDMPCFAGISYSFLNTPYLKLNFTGIASLVEMPFLEKQVHKLILDLLHGIIVLPHRMYYKLDSSCSLEKMYQPPHGLARITLLDGYGFVAEKSLFQKDDIPDVYCKVSLGGGTDQNRLVETPTRQDSSNPVWNYKMDFVCFAYDQLLTIDAFDEDEGRWDPDDDLDQCTITIRDLLLTPDRTKEMELGNTGAFVRFKLDMVPLRTSLRLPNRVGLDKCEDALYGGLVTILVTNVYNIPLPAVEATTYMTVTASTGEVFRTGVCKDAPGVDAVNPQFDSVFHLPLDLNVIATLQGNDMKDKPFLTFSLMKERGKDAKVDKLECLGTTSIPIEALMQTSVIKERHNLGSKGASMDLHVMLRGTVEVDGKDAAPANLGQTLKATRTSVLNAVARLTHMKERVVRTSSKDASVNGEAALEAAVVVPTHKVRVRAIKGRGFKVSKRKFRKADVPDVYLKIKVVQQLGDFQRESPVWTTSYIKDDVNPQWHESKIFEMTDKTNTIVVEGWDHNRRGKDDYYGQAQITSRKVFLLGGKTEIELLDKAGQGTGLMITVGCDMVRT